MLCETQRNYFVKSRRPQTPNLRGYIVRRRRGTTPDWSTHLVRKTSDRLVQQAARSGLVVDHGGRIHCRLRGSQRRCLGPTIPDGIRNHDDPQPVHRQRGSIRIEPDLQLRLPEAAQRAVIPYPPAEPIRQAEDQSDPREEQSCGRPHQAPTDEYSEWMESVWMSISELPRTDGRIAADHRRTNRKATMGS